MKRLILSVFAFAVLGLFLAQEAFAYNLCRNNSTLVRTCRSFACNTATLQHVPAGIETKIGTCTTVAGGSNTLVEHHDIAIKCTW